MKDHKDACLLDPMIEKLLNRQIEIEHEASMVYLSMATWAEKNLYPKTAAFFYAQSLEEREHMMKIIRYLVDLDRTPLLPATPRVNQSYQDLPAMLRQFLSQEQAVTKAIHHMVDLALQQKDYATFQFLQWFVAEQQEEEATARKAIDRCQVLTPEGHRRHALDDAIAHLEREGD